MLIKDFSLSLGGPGCWHVLQMLPSQWRLKPAMAGILIETSLMKYECQRVCWEKSRSSLWELDCRRTGPIRCLVEDSGERIFCFMKHALVCLTENLWFIHLMYSFKRSTLTLSTLRIYSLLHCSLQFVLTELPYAFELSNCQCSLNSFITLADILGRNRMKIRLTGAIVSQDREHIS